MLACRSRVCNGWYRSITTDWTVFWLMKWAWVRRFKPSVWSPTWLKRSSKMGPTWSLFPCPRSPTGLLNSRNGRLLSLWFATREHLISVKTSKRSRSNTETSKSCWRLLTILSRTDPFYPRSNGNTWSLMKATVSRTHSPSWIWCCVSTIMLVIDWFWPVLLFRYDENTADGLRLTNIAVEQLAWIMGPFEFHTAQNL